MNGRSEKRNLDIPRDWQLTRRFKCPTCGKRYAVVEWTSAPRIGVSARWAMPSLRTLLSGSHLCPARPLCLRHLGPCTCGDMPFLVATDAVLSAQDLDGCMD